MTMIYYTGSNNYDPATDPLPIVIRGEDAAGNDLVQIRAQRRSDGVQSSLASGQTIYTFDAYNLYGVAIQAAHITASAVQPVAWRPSCCAVNADGWIFAPSAPFTVNALVASGDSYTLGSYCNDWFRVYRRAGDRVAFPQLHGAAIYDVALDASGNIYVGGEEYGASRYYLRKYDSSGSLTWSASGTTRSDGGHQKVMRLALGPDGSVYVMGLDYGGSSPTRGFVAGYSSTGTQKWKILNSYQPTSIVVHDGDVFLGSRLDESGTWGQVIYDIRKYDPDDGTVLASRSGTNSIHLASNGTDLHAVRYVTWLQYGVAWDHQTIDPDDLATLTEVDDEIQMPLENGNIALSTAGTLYVSDHQKGTYADNAMSLADPCRVHVVEGTHWPSLALPIGLADYTWAGDLATLMGAIPLRLGLAAIVPRREYAGALRLPDVYRVHLSGASPVWLPVSTISIRRDASGETMTLTSPAGTAETISAVLALIGGDATLYRGVRFPDGTEQLEPMAVAPLGSVRSDTGSRAGSITVTATRATTWIPAVPRALQGISYRATSGGKRRVRCAPDTYLVPGDTALLGGSEEMVVGEIVHSIGTALATMELTEA